MTADPADAALDGIRVSFRMLISHPPEQRFDPTGAELLQVRGSVLDRGVGAATAYPEVVVRFGGPRRQELFKWARHGKHLSVDGFLLEIRALINGRMAMLIDAQNIFPLPELNQAEDNDPTKLGVYATHRTRGSAAAAPRGKAARADKMRELLERADA